MIKLLKRIIELLEKLVAFIEGEQESQPDPPGTEEESQPDPPGTPPPDED